MERRFTSGSRQTPDPFDQYLEQNNYYRKHTARDASSLFRVISEQMYDTQLYHLDIRDKCVAYMRKYRQYFESQVNGEFDEYLKELSKPSTNGTLLELQAVSYMFQRSVMLFEPYNLGNYLNKNHSHFSEVFRVFCTPEGHFDSVYATNYIEEAAICQCTLYFLPLCYEILYKSVFKLPDITFAVEQMLHSNEYNTTEFETETNSDGYTTGIYWPDGRRIELDLPQNTNCILENQNYCHFHFSHFVQYSEDLLKDIKKTRINESEKSVLLLRTEESFLPDKLISCVRQLLRGGITPFPYKVAKALDPKMYRNIEFDAWSEIRRELSLKNWYNGDSNFKVGAKCHVKLYKSEKDLYTCYVQEISIDKGYCVVFVEQLGERRLVPYDALKPLPANQFRPWSLPYGLQRHMQKYSSLRFIRPHNYQYKFNNNWYHQQHHHQQYQHPQEYKSNAICDGKNILGKQPIKSDTYIKKITKSNIRQFTHLENFHPQSVHYCTMPLTTTTTGIIFNASERSGTAGGIGANGADDGSDIVNKSHTSSSTMPPHSNPESNSNDRNHENRVCGGEGSTTNLNREYEVEHRNDIAINSGPLYQYHSFNPLNLQGLMDEHIGYNNNGSGLHAPPQPPPVFLPLINGLLPPPFYNIYSGLGNAHMPTSSHIHGPPTTPLQSFPLLPSPQTMGMNSPLLPPGNNAPIAPTISSENIPKAYSNSSVSTIVTTVVTNSTPITSGGRYNTYRSSSINTRINFDAKKSIKLNGADLPTDITTLRYFFNLGLDFYHRNFKHNTTIISGDGVSAINPTAASTPNSFPKGATAVYSNNVNNSGNNSNNNKANVNSKQLECNKIIAKNNNKSSQGNVQQDKENIISNSNYYNHNNYNKTSNKFNQRRFNLRYFKRDQQQGLAAPFATRNNGNNECQYNQSRYSSSIRHNKVILNSEYPVINKVAGLPGAGAGTGAAAAAAAAGINIANQTKSNAIDNKLSNFNATLANHPQHQPNNNASMQMNNNIIQMPVRRAYMAPPLYNNDGIVDTGNSRNNPYMWNSNGALYGASGYDGGNSDYNCENILAAPVFNGNLAPYTATTHGLYVPMPITGQIPPYQIPLPPPAVNMNMNVGIHSIPLNSGNGNGGNGPVGGANGAICQDHFMAPNPFMPVNSIPTGMEMHKGPIIQPGGGLAVNMLPSQSNYHPFPIYYTDPNAPMQQSISTVTNHPQNYCGAQIAASSSPASSSAMSVGRQYKIKRNHHTNININRGQQQQTSNNNNNNNNNNDNNGDMIAAAVTITEATTVTTAATATPATTATTATSATMNCIRNQQTQQTNKQVNNTDVITTAPPVSANFNDKISNDRV